VQVLSLILGLSRALALGHHLSRPLALSHLLALNQSLVFVHVHVHNSHVRDLIANHFSAVQCQEVVLKMSGHFSQRSRDGMSVYYASEFPHYKSIVYRVIGVSDMLTSLSPHMLLLHLA
jgi:hypothetical protein